MEMIVEVSRIQSIFRTSAFRKNAFRKRIFQNQTVSTLKSCSRWKSAGKTLLYWMKWKQKGWPSVLYRSVLFYIFNLKNFFSIPRSSRPQTPTLGGKHGTITYWALLCQELWRVTFILSSCRLYEVGIINTVPILRWWKLSFREDKCDKTTQPFSGRNRIQTQICLQLFLTVVLWIHLRF